MIKSKSKKIMLFFPGPFGGAEMIVANGFRSLILSGENIELWVVGESRSPQAANDFLKRVADLPVKIFLCKSIIDLKLISLLKKEIQLNQISLIHAHGFKAAVYGKLISKKNKLVITHHGKTAHTLKVKLYEMIEDMVMKRAHKVISVSYKMKDDLLNSGIQSTLVENFLSIKEVEKKPLSTEVIKFIFVGRLSPEKGCHLLIEAFRDLDPEKYQLTIAGTGTEETSLKEAANMANTQFLGFQTNVAHLLSTHHVLVMPSLREGLPLTLIEATCSGLPVVASDTGGIPSLIKDGQNGLLVPVGDIHLLKNAVIQISKDYELVKNECEKLRPEFIKRFSLEFWTKRTSEIYNELIQS